MVSTLLLLTAGCQTHHSRKESDRTDYADRLPDGKVVLLRMPDERRYLHVLFQRPSTGGTSQLDPPEAMTGAWIQDETAQRILEADTVGVTFLPMVVGSGLHSFVGTATHRFLRLFAASSPDREAILAMWLAARPLEFESDLKNAIRTSLEADQMTVLFENELAQLDSPPHPDLSLDVHIIAAGMPGGSISHSPNPRNRLILEVRVTIADRAGETISHQFSYKSRQRKFIQWSKDGAQQFAKTRTAALQSVATQVADYVHRSFF